jgi:hypothetical protein
MDAVLEGILAAQKKGGFKAFVQMGDVVRLMAVTPVLTFVKGRCKKWRHTHLSLWWQERQSQGTQDACVCVARRILTTHCTDAYGSEWHTKEH